MMNRIKRAIREWLCAADEGEMLEMSSRISKNSAEASWLEDRIRRLEDASDAKPFVTAAKLRDHIEARMRDFCETVEEPSSPKTTESIRTHPSTWPPVPGKLFMRMRPGS